MIPTNSITDRERCEFLQKLDGSELIVSDWEAQFIESFLRWPKPQWFTTGRRASADKMRMKYGAEPEIKMTFPNGRDGVSPSQADRIPDADPDGCQFLVHGEAGRQHPCNVPAMWRRQNGFRYCQDHADAVKLDLKRRGKVLPLDAIGTAREK